MQNEHGTFREFSYTPKIAGLDDIGSSLITLTVNLTQYRKNLRAIIARAAPAKLTAVVKANAYGFGVGGLLPILSEFEDVSLGVANADEALEIRSLGYSGRIILLGYTHPKNYYQIMQSGCQLSAYRRENIPLLAEACQGLGRKLELHIKVDTGMTRLGVPLEALAEFIAEIKKFPQLEIVGLFSHLVDSGSPSAEVNSAQAAKFEQAIGIAEYELGYHPECHLANSAGLLNFPSTHYDSVRVGLLTYGILPPGDWGESANPGVSPCYTLKSEIIDLHDVFAGDGVSYCHTYKAKGQTRIATMPFGYADGLSLSLSNKAPVLINGAKHKLCGNVTMDYVMADIGENNAAVGDEVVFIGNQGQNCITIEEVSALAGTIPYEITCGLGRRVRREYMEE